MYAYGNPLKYNDPTGHQAACVLPTSTDPGGLAQAAVNCLSAAQQVVQQSGPYAVPAAGVATVAGVGTIAVYGGMYAVQWAAADPLPNHASHFPAIDTTIPLPGLPLNDTVASGVVGPVYTTTDPTGAATDQALPQAPQSPTGDTQTQSGQEPTDAHLPTPPIDPSDYDYANPPGEGWVWKGDPVKGAWVREETKEYLRADLQHLPPEGPHYDWRAPSGKMYRIPVDGGPPQPKSPSR